MLMSLEDSLEELGGLFKGVTSYDVFTSHWLGNLANGHGDWEGANMIVHHSCEV